MKKNLLLIVLFLFGPAIAGCGGKRCVRYETRVVPYEECGAYSPSGVCTYWETYYEERRTCVEFETVDRF